MRNALIAAAWLTCLVLASASRARAEATDWRTWRGPDAGGSIEQGQFPVTFSAEKNRWRAELPGKGCSTPIVVGQKVYVTAAADGKDALLCYDLADGSETWRAVFGPENRGKHRNGSGSNASPASDGQAVFIYFKSGTLAAVEVDGDGAVGGDAPEAAAGAGGAAGAVAGAGAGKVRWQTNLVERFGPENLYWDHGTSPVLTKRHIVMARMHEGESWLAAFDKVTGEMAWKVARNYDTPRECDNGYSTPLVIEHQGRESILVWGAEHVTIHDAADGRMTFSCGNFNPEEKAMWPSIASPVVVGDTAVIAYGRNDRGLPRLFGIRLAGEGDVTKTNHAWKRTDVGTFVPTPAVHRGRVIFLRDRGEVACLDPATGQTIWESALPRHRTNYYASPLIAGDTLYAAREDGTVFVASIAGDTLKVLAENDMGESIIGSPVPAPAPSGNRLLLRGTKHLFCVGGD